MFPPNEIDGHAFNPICNALPKVTRSDSGAVNSSTRSGVTESGGTPAPAGANVNAVSSRLTTSTSNIASSSAMASSSTGAGAREEANDTHNMSVAAALNSNTSNVSIAIRRGSGHNDPGSDGGRRASRLNSMRVTDDLGIGVGNGAAHAMVCISCLNCFQSLIRSLT